VRRFGALARGYARGAVVALAQSRCRGFGRPPRPATLGPSVARCRLRWPGTAACCPCARWPWLVGRFASSPASTPGPFSGLATLSGVRASPIVARGVENTAHSAHHSRPSCHKHSPAPTRRGAPGGVPVRRMTGRRRGGTADREPVGALTAARTRAAVPVRQLRDAEIGARGQPGAVACVAPVTRPGAAARRRRTVGRRTRTVTVRPSRHGCVSIVSVARPAISQGPALPRKPRSGPPPPASSRARVPVRVAIAIPFTGAVAARARAAPGTCPRGGITRRPSLVSRRARPAQAADRTRARWANATAQATGPSFTDIPGGPSLGRRLAQRPKRVGRGRRLRRPRRPGYRRACGDFRRWARRVSNLRPLACEASALPLSYAPSGTSQSNRGRAASAPPATTRTGGRPGRSGARSARARRRRSRSRPSPRA
jgi:hypothetical protein